jgi:hypothetical protein
MALKKINGVDSFVSECPCKNFISIKNIGNALESEEHTTRLIEWLCGEPKGSNHYLACQQPNQLNLRCTNRVKASFSILDAIREDCREFLANASTNIAVNTPIFNSTTSRSTKALPPVVLSYEESFPSLSTSSEAVQAAPNMLVGRKKPKSKILTAPVQVSNEVQKQKRRMRPSPTNQSPASGNITMLPSVDPIMMRPKTSGWVSASATKQVMTATQLASHGKIAGSPSSIIAPKTRPTIWGGTAPIAPTTIAPEMKYSMVLATRAPSTPRKVVEDLIDDQVNNASDDVEVPIQTAQLCRLARVYVSLIQQLLVPSTAVELHLLIRLLAVSDLKEASTGDFKLKTLKRLFISPRACRQFAMSTLDGIMPLLCKLPLTILTAIIDCPPFRERMPESLETLSAIRAKRMEVLVAEGALDIGGGPHSTPMLSLPFDQQRDSRHNYKTKEEQAMFKNREESRDAFLYQLRFFQNTRGKILDTSELNASVQKVKTASKNVIQGVHKLNMNWFAEFFCELLLQLGLVPMEETDTDLLSITDKDKLQKLHKRFSSKVGATKKSGGKVNFGQNEDSGVSSPISEAQQRFPGHQEFFFLFIQSIDSYSFSVHLKSRLAMLVTGMTSSFSLKGLSTKLLKLQLLSRFLGLLVFSPNWGTGSEIHVLSADDTKSWIATTEPCLPFLEMIKSAWAHRQVVTVIPWVVEYLRMAKWDKVSLHRSPSLNLLLAILRTIHLSLQGKSELESPNTLYISAFLETLFGDVYGLGRTSYLRMVELPHLISETVDSDALDSVPLSLNSELVFTSNPYLEDLLSLATSLSQTTQSMVVSRKLIRPSIVSPSKAALLATDDGGTEVSNLDFSISSISFNISSPVNTDDSASVITTKLVDAFFHQHRELKDTCEFVVDRAVKNAASLALQRFMAPRLDEALKADLDAYVPIHQLQALANRTAKASRGVAQKVLEDTVRRSLDLLSPVGTPEAVKNMAASLCIAHGLKLIEPILANNAAVESKKVYDECLRQRKKYSIISSV